MLAQDLDVVRSKWPPLVQEISSLAPSQHRIAKAPPSQPLLARALDVFTSEFQSLRQRYRDEMHRRRKLFNALQVTQAWLRERLSLRIEEERSHNAVPGKFRTCLRKAQKLCYESVCFAGSTRKHSRLLPRAPVAL